MRFEFFEVLAHGAVFASGDEPKRKEAAFPGKDGGGNRKLLSAAAARESAELGSVAITGQPEDRPRHRTPANAPDGRTFGVERKPPAENGPARPTSGGGWRDGHPIGVLQRRRRIFPRAVLHKVSPERLTPSQQAVVGVRQREQGKQGEGLSTALAKAASDPNPVVMFIVCLLATATVTDDGITFAKRASPQHDLLAAVSPIGFELVRRGAKWDKENRGSRGLCPGVDPPRSEPEAEPLLLKRKIPTGEE